MVLCPVCSHRLPDDTWLCPQHVGGPSGSWSAGNRIMCDFVHRGVEPARVREAERLDESTAVRLHG